MNELFSKIHKSSKSILFNLSRKTEDFPLKVIFIVISFVILIALVSTVVFNNPPAKVTTNIVKRLPWSLRFPKSLKEKIKYDRKKRTITFKGMMSEKEKYVLQGLLKKNKVYQDSIEKLYEKSKGEKLSIGDSLWWAIVTLTTVGYGDLYPEHPVGRILAVVLMGFGLIFTSVLSGTIASIFVERKLQAGRGMKELDIKDHIVICGWNDTASNLIKSLPLAGGSDLRIVLVNELDEDTITEIRISFKDLDIKFVKGDFTREEVLKRANISKAKSAIILADASGGHSLNESDQRTIIAAFAIKNMATDSKVAAELSKKENEEHLKRAGVDDILIYGEFGGFLLSHAAISPGVPSLIMELLSFSVGNTITKTNIPHDFVDKTFLDLSNYYRTKKKAILIGILSEEKDVTLDDILSGEGGGIDQFIKNKFSQVEDEYFGDETKYNVKLNPGEDYIIQDIDVAFVITKDIITT